MIRTQTPTRDLAAEHDRHCESVWDTCGACPAEGRVATAENEQRVCACGKVICRRCWRDGVRVCVACESQPGEEPDEDSL